MNYDKDDKISSVIEEIINIYTCLSPGTEVFDIWMKTGVSLRALEDVFSTSCLTRSEDEAISLFMSRYHLPEDENNDFINVLRKFLTFASDIGNPNQRQFIEKCAELHLATYVNMYDGICQYPELPTIPRGATAFIDLASGPDFKNYFNKFSDGTFYFAVDVSPFACEVLRAKAAQVGLRNFNAICKDVADLEKSDISEHEIGVIRAKNIFCYAPAYLSLIEKHLGWLCDGGKFIFAEQASEANANSSFIDKNLVARFEWLIANGWGFSFSFGDIENPLDLNQVIFTKGDIYSPSEGRQKMERFHAELLQAYGF